MAEAEAIRFNTTAVGTDQLDDLAKVIGRIAVEAFNSPEVRKQFEEWKKTKEKERGKKGNGKNGHQGMEEYADNSTHHNHS